MHYDGPSFNHRRKQVNFDPFKKHEDKKSSNNESNNFNFKSDHYDKLPKRVKTRGDRQNEAAKILSAKPRTESLFEKRQQRKYRPRFRVTEVPSPMFGYSNEQRERMGLNDSETQEEIEWNYSALKDLMISQPYNFILTEECLNASILRDWQSSPET